MIDPPKKQQQQPQYEFQTEVFESHFVFKRKSSNAVTDT